MNVIIKPKIDERSNTQVICMYIYIYYTYVRHKTKQKQIHTTIPVTAVVLLYSFFPTPYGGVHDTAVFTVYRMLCAAWDHTSALQEKNESPSRLCCSTEETPGKQWAGGPSPPVTIDYKQQYSSSSILSYLSLLCACAEHLWCLGVASSYIWYHTYTLIFPYLLYAGASYNELSHNI